MKYPSPRIVIYSVAALILLALVVVIVIQKQNETVVPVQGSSLYDFAPVEKVTFNAVGKVTEVNKETKTISIERLGETLSMSLSEEARVMIFTIPAISDNADLEPQMVEPELGSLDDIQIDANASVFGTQTKDGSLIVENITIERQ